MLDLSYGWSLLYLSIDTRQYILYSNVSNLLLSANLASLYSLSSYVAVLCFVTQRSSPQKKEALRDSCVKGYSIKLT